MLLMPIALHCKFNSWDKKVLTISYGAPSKFHKFRMYSASGTLALRLWVVTNVLLWKTLDF